MPTNPTKPPYPDPLHPRSVPGPVLVYLEQIALLQACDLRIDSGFRDYALLTLLLDTALRPAEVCRLTVESLHDLMLLTVVGKGGYKRTVPLGLNAGLTLGMYIARHRLPAQHDERALFLTDDGSPLDVVTLSSIVRDAGTRSGLSPSSVTVHMLRRTAIMRIEDLRQCMQLHLKGEA